MTKRKKTDVIKGRIVTSEGPKQVVFPTSRDFSKPDPVVKSEESVTDNGQIKMTLEVEGECLGCGDPGKECSCNEVEAPVECPKCHTIDTELLIPDESPSVTHYRCSLCGEFYLITEAGEYNW